VIVKGYKTWGIKIVDKLKGMFSFGLVDLTNQKLFLVRDRFGIKPLYYAYINGEFSFASELKALIRFSPHQYQIDFSSFADFFTYRYIPSPKTIWRNIFKLPPANYLEFDLALSKYTIQEYWSIHFSEKKSTRAS
jgi:asparagine synthase (glutamine-hydrolysing)